MRISDWSSDVCSSDLRRDRWPPRCELPFDFGQSIPSQFFTIGQQYGGRRGDMLRLAQHVYRAPLAVHAVIGNQIGRASCRERVCQYVSISVVAGTSKKNTLYTNTNSTYVSNKS